jgi:alpha-glucosidase (family GH31 glycosyl hydrolase)
MSALAAAAHVTGAPLMMSPWLLHPERRDLAAIDTAFYFGPGLYIVPVVTRGATSVTTKLPPGEFIDLRDGSLHDGGMDTTLPAPITEMPVLLVDGQLVPMLDPTIDTLAEETSPDVVGPTDVADVYDVTGVISAARGTATFTLAGGATLTAHYDGSAVACNACTVTQLGERVQRVRVETTADLAAGGLSVSSTGVTRRLRWDLYLVD